MFEEGQKVKIKPNASLISHRYVMFTGEMRQYQGKEAIITKATTAATSGTRIYRLSINKTYWFVDEWLESTEQINDISTNEICKILEDK